MTPSTGKRKSHFKNIIPADPNLKPFGQWSSANKGFYADFRKWLKLGGYGFSALNTYGVAARMALGYLDKSYWAIDPIVDLDKVREYIDDHFESAGTRSSYKKGLLKLGEYLSLRLMKPKPEKPVNWPHYTGTLPDWLAEYVQDYVAHCKRSWPPDRVYRNTITLLSPLTRPLRWMAEHRHLESIPDITPDRWYDYLETRLVEGISPITVNSELRRVQSFLEYLESANLPVCRRMLLVDALEEGYRLPKDAPIEQLRAIQSEIQAQAASFHSSKRRMGVLDMAWFLLMLHGGLRTGEIRRLKIQDIDWEGRKIRIEQSKGLKDRCIFLSQAAFNALQAYIAVRGKAAELPEEVFLYRHRPLGGRYCAVRLNTYGKRCGYRITPHQLRHSCSTLLLNAGAPILAVQMILGHKHIDTTLGYARLYDGTLAADYYRAMAQVESYLTLEGTEPVEAPNLGELLVLIDSLRLGNSGQAQADVLQSLRAGILKLAKQEPVNIVDVKVPV